MIKFGIDIDGTLTTTDWMLESVNKYFGRNLRQQDLVVFNLSEILNVTPGEVNDFFNSDASNILDPPIREGAKTILKLMQRGYDYEPAENKIYFVTARPESLYNVTYSWLEKELKPHGITFDLICVGSHDKVSAIKEKAVDIFFEDHPNNVVQINRECNIPVVMFDAPYNQNVETDNVNIYRVDCWAGANSVILKWDARRSGRCVVNA